MLKRMYRFVVITTAWSISLYLIRPILPLFIVSVGASRFELGFIPFIAYLFEILLHIPFGTLGDRVGRRPLVLLALTCQLTSMVLYFLTPNKFWLYPATALQSISMASFSSSALAIASDLAPAEMRGQAIGLYFTSYGISMFTGPFLCSLLTKFLSYNYVFLVTSLFPLFGLIISMLGGLPSGKPMRSDEVRGKVNFAQAIRALISSKNAISVLLGRIALITPLYTFNTLFPVYSEEVLLLSASIISLLFALRGFSNMLIRMPIGKFSDTFGRKRPYIIACALPIVSLLTISQVKDLTVIAILMILYGIGWGMSSVLAITLLSESVPRRVGGLALAVNETMIGLGRSLGSLTAGLMVSVLPVPMILQISAAVGLLGFISAAVLIEE